MALQDHKNKLEAMHEALVPDNQSVEILDYSLTDVENKIKNTKALLDRRQRGSEQFVIAPGKSLFTLHNVREDISMGDVSSTPSQHE